MTETHSDVEAALEAFHTDVPHQFQVSLTMSVTTRDNVSAVRDELNEIAGSNEFTTNDVMRLALTAAARYHAVATGEVAELEEFDSEQLVPLTAVIRRAIDEEWLPAEGSEATD
jgi:hypothetical protein